MKEKSIILIIIVLYIFTFISNVTYVINTKNKMIELQNKIKWVEYQLHETEKRCERMTDACIDILANKRWE